jgi:ankyrin repeat protein
MKKIRDREFLPDAVDAPPEWRSFVDLVGGNTHTDVQTGARLSVEYVVDRIKAGFDPLRWKIGHRAENLLERVSQLKQPVLTDAVLPLLQLEEVVWPTQFADRFMASIYKDSMTMLSEQLLVAGFAGHSASVFGVDVTPARFNVALDNLKATGAVRGLDELLRLCLEKEAKRTVAFLARDFPVEGNTAAQRGILDSVWKFHNDTLIVREILGRYKLGELIKDQNGASRVSQVHAVSARQDKDEFLPFVLAHGASIDERGAKGRTALMVEIERRQSRAACMEAIAGWVARGADVNAVDSDGKSVLRHAVDSGNVEVVDVLYCAGVDLMARDTNGKVAFGAGAAGAYCEHLLGRTIPAGHNMAMIAAAGAWPEKLREAFDNGDDPAHLNDNGHSVLDVALDRTYWHLPHKRQSPEVFQILGHAGVDMNAPVKVRIDKVTTLHHPLHHLVACCAENPKQGLEMLEAYLCAPGVDIDVKDEKGYTALYLAVKEGDPDVVKALLDAGADTGIRCGRLTLMGQAKSDVIKKLLYSASTVDKVSDAVEVVADRGEAGTPIRRRELGAL